MKNGFLYGAVMVLDNYENEYRNTYVSKVLSVHECRTGGEYGNGRKDD